MLRVKEVTVEPKQEGVDSLAELFKLQGDLVKMYVDKKGQRPFPMPLSDKDNQKFLKELVGFLEEEIFEAYEVLEEIQSQHTKDRLKPADAKKLIEDYNEEQADGLHFFIEVLQYANVSVESLQEYYGLYFEAKDQLQMLDITDTLQTAFNHAMTVDYLAGQRVHFKLIDTTDDLTTGGTRISGQMMAHSKNALFEVIKYLRLATNQLRSKYWKEGESEPNYELFFDYLIEAWLHYILYLKIAGFTPESVRATYIRKNQVNIDRINNNY